MTDNFPDFVSIFGLGMVIGLIVAAFTINPLIGYSCTRTELLGESPERTEKCTQWTKEAK